MPNTAEARIARQNNILLVLSPLDDDSWSDGFLGSVIDVSSVDSVCFNRKNVYLCGDLSNCRELDLSLAKQVRIVDEHSHGTANEENWPHVNVGQLPTSVHGVGILYKRFFDPAENYFQRICEEHEFQTLTESTKPGKAHRTGLYLTPVQKSGDDLHFRLLRCSTNLSGPTDNFRATDAHVVDALNQEASLVLEDHAPMNHVLAQVYHNTPASSDQKQTKAKIKSHADKTKDMPTNGIMAFCTFYDQLDKVKPLPSDPFDMGYKSTSGLTQLRFRLKEPEVQDQLPTEFTVTLYPGSVFLMPLSTNRLYTHETRPSTLDAEKLPTRLGYVVRCSSTEAVHQDGQTFLKTGDQNTALEPATTEGMNELRELYAKENRSTDFIDYGNRFRFSMNNGDYLSPNYRIEDEFRVYHIQSGDNLFDELVNSVDFEQLGKGRRGTILVKPDLARGTPIVRTTTNYTQAAQQFTLLHDELTTKIRCTASLATELNNALIETYTNAYSKMGLHSDQALDLGEVSHIALYSCYRNPDALKQPRTLVIESKDANKTTCEIPLAHGSVVVFSTDANRRFKHKIVLANPSGQPENDWLGITFRTSKTYVSYRDDQARFEDGSQLTLADNEQRQAFFQLRGQENRETEFRYPRVSYTLSKSDLMAPCSQRAVDTNC